MNAEAKTGWVLEGFHAIAALWLWMVVVLLHALFRLAYRPGPDPIRPSGPIY